MAAQYSPCVVSCHHAVSDGYMQATATKLARTVQTLSGGPAVGWRCVLRELHTHHTQELHLCTQVAGQMSHCRLLPPCREAPPACSNRQAQQQRFVPCCCLSSKQSQRRQQSLACSDTVFSQVAYPGRGSTQPRARPSQRPSAPPWQAMHVRQAKTC